MPRFFFDFHDSGRDRGADSEGLDLENEEIARKEAMVAVLQVLQLEETDDDRRRVECRVRNDSGKEVYKVSLSLEGVWASDKIQYPKFERLQRG